MNHSEIIRFAHQKGLRFDFETQELITSTGRRVKPKLYGTQRYPAYTIAVVKKERVSFNIHKFAGFLLFGELALQPGIHVRHLDGNSLNLSVENLAVGTASDNELDKPKEERLKRGSAARKAQIDQGIRTPNKILSDDQAEELIRTYKRHKELTGRAPFGHWKAESIKYKISIAGVKQIAYGLNFAVIHERIKNEQC